MNLFRCTPDGRLDREYLRTCAVYKLLKRGCVNKTRAVELLKCPKPLATVEIWLSGPLKTSKGRDNG
jgi:hypothetical protein